MPGRSSFEKVLEPLSLIRPERTFDVIMPLGGEPATKWVNLDDKPYRLLSMKGPGW